MDRAASRRAKAAPKLAMLLMDDRFLLQTVFDNERIHSEGSLGGNIESIFHAYGRDLELVKLALTKAVEHTPEPELLFRQDSVFTEIANRFMKAHGRKYLCKVLRPTIKNLLQRSKAGEEFGIDSSRSSGSSVERVLQAVNEIMLNIASKLSCLSPEIKIAISTLIDATEAKFGASKRGVAIVGLFWLRYMCPAIVDPMASGVLKKSHHLMTVESQRALLSLSKAVKACADGQFPENFNVLAASRLQNLSAQWRGHIDACFTKAPTIPDRSIEKFDPKEAIAPASALLQVFEKRRSEIAAALSEKGAIATLLALENVLELASSGVEKPHYSLGASPPSHDVSIKSPQQRSVECWTTEKILCWLDCLGLGHHRPVFARKEINGAALLALDPAGLLLLGVDNEEEQWQLLQSLRDVCSLRSRYQHAAELRGPNRAFFPPLDVSSASSEFAWPLEDSSSSSGSPASARSSNPPSSTPSSPPLPNVDSPKGGASLENSASSVGKVSTSSYLFRVRTKKDGILLIRTRQTDTLQYLQLAIAKELGVISVEQCLVYRDSITKHQVQLTSEESFRRFLETEGALNAHEVGGTCILKLSMQ